MHFGRTEVLRGLWNFLNMDRPEHHSTDRLKERGVEKGGGQHSPSRVGNDLFSTKHWYCFECNLEETAERRGGARTGLPERYDAILS